MARVLVTGGSGRLGRRICARLAQEHEVSVFDLVPPAPGIPFVQGGLDDTAALGRAVEGIDVVVHLAGIPIYTGDDLNIMQVNAMGSFQVLLAAGRAGVRGFIGASSICALGFIFWSRPFTPDYFPVDEDLPGVVDDAYGLSKVILEQAARAAARRYGMKAISLRLATVWDPDDPQRQELLMAPLDDPERGARFLWNYVDVRDVAEAFVLSLKRFEAVEAGTHEVFHIGARDCASRLTSLELIRRYFPDVKAVRNAGGSLWDEHFALWGIERARRVLGFEPHHTWREYAR